MVHKPLAEQFVKQIGIPDLAYLMCRPNQCCHTQCILHKTIIFLIFGLCIVFIHLFIMYFYLFRLAWPWCWLYLVLLVLFNLLLLLTDAGAITFTGWCCCLYTGLKSICLLLYLLFFLSIADLIFWLLCKDFNIKIHEQSSPWYSLKCKRSWAESWCGQTLKRFSWIILLGEWIKPAGLTSQPRNRSSDCHHVMRIISVTLSFFLRSMNVLLCECLIQ